MNNFELDDQVKILATTKTNYELAKELVLLRESLPSIKSDAVKKAMLNCDAHWSENIGDDAYRVSEMQDCADKLERGDL